MISSAMPWVVALLIAVTAALIWIAVAARRNQHLLFTKKPEPRPRTNGRRP